MNIAREEASENVMAAVMKMMGMVTVMLLPGGLIVLCAYFLGRAVHGSWSREREVWGETASLRRAVARVRFKDVLREARATFRTVGAAST